MKFRSVQYFLTAATIILLAGCAAVYNNTEVRLRYASINGNTNTVKQILTEHEDINVNTTDENGNTALMHAATSSKVNIAKLLLGAGADVHMKNKDRSTALIIAAWHGQVNMVEALINAGADVNVKNKAGNTALMIATANERKEIVRLLAAAGAVDKLDRTALMLPHSMMTTLP